MLTSWTKLLAVLTLGSTITLGACAMDDANSGDDTTGTAQQPLVSGFTNFIINPWNGNLGVFDANGNSQLLLPGQNTANVWATTGGFTIGSGFCADLQRSDNRGSTWGPQARVTAGRHPIGANTSYIVFPVKC
jgi:hypothetical protein